MNDNLTIKWPWEMVELSSIDEIVSQIKVSLPSDHQLKKNPIFPGIKWDRRPIFIVEDDATGEYFILNYEGASRGKRSILRIPKITLVKSRDELRAIIERDHRTEVAKYRVTAP